MKGIFSYNSNIEKNAYLNWQTDRHNDVRSMITLAKGYMEAGLILTAQVLESNKRKRADRLIFPILYNVNHSIELYLKATLRSLNFLLNNDHGIGGGHDIKQIYSTVKSRVKE